MRFVLTFVLSFLIFGCSASPAGRDQAITDVPQSPKNEKSTELEGPVSNTLECENTVGVVGFADISFDATTVLRFYDKPEAPTAPAQTLGFYRDEALKMDSFKAEGKRTYSLLRPEVHKLDYYLFDLAVKRRNTGWLEIQVDDETKETLWLQESKTVKFQDWLQKLKSSFAVGRRTKDSNPLRMQPDSKSEEVSFLGNDCFAVVEMRGDWIQVNIQNHCTDAPKQSVSGWLRWRDDNGCLLVEIFPFA